MAMEPTREQLKAVEEALERHESDYTDDEGTRCTSFSVSGAAETAFALIRDMVLAQAVTACEELAERANQAALDPKHPERRVCEECTANGAANCASLLRSLKGSP